MRLLLTQFVQFAAASTLLYQTNFNVPFQSDFDEVSGTWYEQGGMYKVLAPSDGALSSSGRMSSWGQTPPFGNHSATSELTLWSTLSASAHCNTRLPPTHLTTMSLGSLAGLPGLGRLHGRGPGAGVLQVLLAYRGCQRGALGPRPRRLEPRPFVRRFLLRRDLSGSGQGPSPPPPPQPVSPATSPLCVSNHSLGTLC